MMKTKRILSLMLSLVMLLGMMVSASAEITGDINCYHQWAWSWPQGQPTNCQDWKPSQEYCVKCGALGGYYDQCGPCVPGSKTWISPQATNCMEFGVWEIACKYCGEWLDGREEPGPHKWVTRVVQEPGCTWPGLKETICSVCGSEPNTPYEEIPELGHDWGTWHWAHGYEANCAQGAWQVRDCKRCSAQEDRWIGPGAHSWGEWKWQSGGAFCTDEGTEVRTCSKCGATEERPAPGGKHSWGEWKWKGGVPSCEKTGIQVRICTKCGMTEEREVAGGNHNWGEWKVYEAPTCLEKGVEHRQCSICGQYWTREMDALGHEMGEWITIKQPTADENGLKERKCVRCDYTEQEEIPYNYGDIEYAFASLSKREASAPVNGECYTLGETVLYSVIFTVPEGLTLLDVEITDPIKGNNEDAVLDIIPEADGGEYTYSVSHVVTETDIENGFVSNIATAYFFDPEGDAWVSVSSNEVKVLTGEEDNSAVILEKIDMRGPANGEYYVPGETIKYGLTVRSDENNPLENIVIYDPLKGGDQIVFGPADSWVLGAGFDYTVTEADAQRGYIENTGYATFTYQNTGKEDTVYSNTLILPCGPGELPDDYMAPGSLTLTVTEDSKRGNGAYYVPGEFIQIIRTITNTSDSVTMTHDYDHIVETRGDGTSERDYHHRKKNLQPGEFYSIGRLILVKEADAALGYIEKTYTVNYTGDDGNVYTATGSIRIPCGPGELPDDYMAPGSLTLTVTEGSKRGNGAYYVPGELMYISRTITNTSDSVTMTYDYEHVVKTRGEGTSERDYQGKRRDLPPGDSYGIGEYRRITEADAALGYIENTYTVNYTGDDGNVYTATGSIRLPCGPGELPDDYQDPGSVMLTLIEWSEPDNGTHYVPGEKINVYHRISNNSRDVTMTMDHQHFFEICGDGIKEKDDSLYSKVLLPGTSYGVYFWGPTVTEADAARGYVERTTTFYLMGDDGNEYTATGSVRLPCGPGELPDDYVPPVDPDIDGDGIPNEEDPDIDGDGIPNGEDPDVDGDGIPNGSDPDADGDGIPNGDDPDVDGDGTPNGSDPDVDGDGTPNGEDPDVDGDGVPNGGDPDIDGDGIPNEEDPDMDGDGIPNEDDPDADGDGIPDEDGDFGLSDCLTLVKTLLSTPANGNYFVPGEEVEYSVLVKNTGDALTGLVVSDWMWDAPRSFGDIQKGEDVTYPVNYTVTDADARAQHVNNIAQAEAVDMNGNSVCEYSNLVSIPCGFPDLDGDGKRDDPFGILSGLEVTKEVESLPLNGAYYTEGEKVAYKITYVNAGEIPLIDVEIFDPLFGLGGMASAELLNSGESRTCRFEYEITKADVERGYVYNEALAVYIVNDATATARSNGVTVDTDGMPDDPATPLPWTPGEELPDYDPGDGWIVLTPEDPFGEVDLGGIPDTDECCTRTILNRDSASASYEIGYCPAHMGVLMSTSMMKKAAATPEMKAQASTYMITLWRGEVEKMYEKLMAAASPEAKCVIMAEYMNFVTELANLEIMLKAMNLSDPAEAYMKIADLWEEKCISMCIEMHTEPSARKDSLLDAACAVGEPCEACENNVISEGNGKKTIKYAYCPMHAFTFSMTDAITLGEDNKDVWTMVRQIWNVEMTAAYNKLYAALGANQVLAMAEYHALTQWMMAREASLIAMYPDNPELVAQTMTKIIMDRVNELCALTK